MQMPHDIEHDAVVYGVRRPIKRSPHQVLMTCCYLLQTLLF